MPASRQNSVSNRLLHNMAAADFETLLPNLQLINLSLRQQVVWSSEPISHVLFPENSVASVIGTTARGKQSEVGLIGCEGAVGIAAIDGIDTSPLDVLVQVPGEAYCIKATTLAVASEASPTLSKLLRLYAQSFLIQVSCSAMAYASSTVRPRLARYLLMAQDRVGGGKVVMTHDFLSLMLAVRRAGVTLTLHDFEAQGIVRTGRGVITIIDRKRLMGIADDAYGVPEVEYRRLLGFDPHTVATGSSPQALHRKDDGTYRPQL